MASGGGSHAAAKLKEGDKLVAEAEKSLKTNWLKWNPDYDNASHSFDKAGLCYRTAKSYEKAIQAYDRAADTHYKNNAVFQAAKALEQIANIYSKDLKDMGEASTYLQRCSAMYHESGHGDTAGQVLAKAAKLMEASDPQMAAFYYLETADLHDIEEKYRDEAKAIRAAVNMYAKARVLDKMLETLKKLRKITLKTGNDKYMFELAAIEIVIHLHNDDAEAASQALDSASRLSGFSQSEYGPVLESLVEAYKERDEEEFTKCCSDSIFKIMDNEVAKLVRDLKTKLGFTGFDPQSASGLGEDEEPTPDIC